MNQRAGVSATTDDTADFRSDGHDTQKEAFSYQQ